jgi:hypothetical protein
MSEKIKIIGNEKVPQSVAVKYNEIATIIINFWDEVQNEDIKRLSLKALTKLSRLRSSPITNGGERLWAAGISYAIGSVNFIIGNKLSNQLTPDYFAQWFGYSKISVKAKSNTVKKAINLTQFSKEFTLKDFMNI